MKKIITIGREFGSGGRELGRRIAEILNIEYYDHEIIEEISKHTQLSEEYVRNIVEHKPHNLFPITIAQSMAYVQPANFRTTMDIFAAQRTVICEMAEKSDCVIVGRCADEILREQNPFRIFVYADMESKMARCRQREQGEQGKSKTDKELQKEIERVDKRRAEYYQLFTQGNWGDKQRYDICVNTSRSDLKTIAESLATLIKEVYRKI